MSPQDPVTPLAESAAQLHELFLAYAGGGFTEDQAFAIVLAVVTTLTAEAFRRQPPPAG